MYEEALLNTTTDQKREGKWDLHHELLAQLIEVASVPAAQMQLDKPVKVPRPDSVGHGADAAREGSTAGMRHAIGVLKASANPRG
jgi:hypothetical protein